MTSQEGMQSSTPPSPTGTSMPNPPIIQEQMHQMVPTTKGFSFFNLFQGRLNRRNIWAATVVLYIAFNSLFFLFYVNLLGKHATGMITILTTGVFVILGLYSSISLSIRRLHDLGKSGWYLLLNFIPVVAFCFAIYLLFWPGDPVANKYGVPPKKRLDIKAILGLV